MKNMTFRKSLTAAAVAASLGFPALAVAQDAQDETGAEEQVERIQVTGSRIRRTDMEGANPVQVLSREDLEKVGIASVGDILQNIPSAGSAINTTVNNGGDGSVQLDIRNLGANRTLVLVNGRRWAPTLGGAVDLNNIPTTIIERIEVLKDGASAVYGSDAISAVVNIITRKDFNGIEFNSYYGQYDEGDGQTEQHDLSIGTADSRGSVFINASYTKQEPVWAGDREISAVPTFGAPEGYGGSSGTPFGRLYYFDEDGNALNHKIVTGDRGNTQPWEGSDAFNFAPMNYLLTPQERTNFYGQGTYNIDNNLRVRAETFFGNRQSSQLLAPTPLFLGPGGGDSETVIEAGNPFNPFDYDLSAQSEFGDPGHLFLLGRRMVEAGPRIFNQDVDHYQFSTGIEGDFEAMGRYFDWDVNYIYSRIQQNTLGTGELNMQRVRNALSADCGGDEECAYLDLFGGEGAITQEMVDYIEFTAQDTLETELKGYTANLSGDLAYLPAGTLGFAVGAEKRWVSGFDQPDALKAAGITSGNARQPTDGAYDVDEYYAEFVVPLLADAPLAEELTLEVASRYSEYSNFGDTTNSKVGFTWKPFSDLMVRGTYSEAFRAPSVLELFRGQSDSFNTLTDPCNGGAAANPDKPGCAGIPASYEQANPQIRTTIGGNPDLLPEEAESQTLGFVYNPSAIDNLSMTLDVYDIEIDNTVTTVGAQTILDACAENNTLCNLIDRGSSGAVSDLRNFNINANSRTAKGFDWSVQYQFDTDYGTFAIQHDGSYVDENQAIIEDQVSGDLETINYAGQAYDGFVVPRVRSNTQLTWSQGDLSINWIGRYIHSTTESCDFGDEALNSDLCFDQLEDGSWTKDLGSTMYHDVQAVYSVTDNLRVTFGVNNVFDKEPAVSYSAFANSFDPSMYEVPGMFPYARLSVNF
ncbi:TonB-dependent receptor plug domain-containing protein [Idiomarina sp. UBA4520]|jgi:outer membrane receptor protein involved in Fe transport|uniref:TonB-dependent receptor plug domain-containing protein n=1 Tax=Idiomarina sp. UBA4520 TaxID=1946647 RepID=UPI000B01552D|nr:TonB-dependent receptor [Idiomarina sp. UBA4520]MBF39730.1 TonB-dependent receptor [Idiomarinaceae bacterium]|tara:strand:+ start:8937 stop:11705 length:2769 start_codon:yes stop_codon:yes gene_type:complete